MLRSLPPVSRIIPAILFTLIATILAYRSVFYYRSSAFSLCDENGQCSAEEVTRPPSRQEFRSLEHRIQLLSEDIDKLRNQEPPKPPTQEELIWENRRKECGEGVVRNIDYQHVHLRS